MVPSARRYMGRNRKWVLQDDIQEAVWRTILRGPRPPSQPVAICPEVTEEVDPAEAQRVSRSATWTRRATTRPATPSRFSPISTDRRHCAQLDTRGHHRGCSCGSAPFGRSCGSTWGGESSREALLTALKAAKAKLNVPISVQIESTTQYLERARKRLAQAEAEVARVTAQKDQCVADVEAAERRLERLQDSAPSAMQQEPAELVQLQSRIDELIRERDSLRVSGIQGHVEVAASSTEEVNMLRANVDSLERERAMLRAEVARCRANADPSALMSTLIDQGDILARESGSSNRLNPLRQ